MIGSGQFDPDITSSKVHIEERKVPKYDFPSCKFGSNSNNPKEVKSTIIVSNTEKNSANLGSVSCSTNRKIGSLLYSINMMKTISMGLKLNPAT